MSVWNFFLVTFGCKVNQYETQSLREAWQGLGGVECSSPAEADVICVNSCAITAKGERDARNAVFRLRREAPDARLILTGCAAHLFADYRPRPGAAWAAPDLLVPQEHKDLLLQGPWSSDFAGPDSCATASATLPAQHEKMPSPSGSAPLLTPFREVNRPQKAEEHASTTMNADTNADAANSFPSFNISTFKRARPVLKVQDGCAHRCTYCIVPLTRGKPRSRPVEHVLAETRRLLESGHVEIMISGINLGQYGRDAQTGDFWNLLRTLDTALAPEFAGLARFRISSLEPGQLDERALDILRHCRMLCPHLHISLQHGSRNVLKRMGRGHYSPAMLEEAVRELSAHWPAMGLGADIIAGFPGETEKDVQELLELVARLPLGYAHVFPYSRRPGTAAERFEGQIPHALKLERAARVRQAVALKQKEFLMAQMALPRMLLAADISGSIQKAPQAGGKKIKGVNEYYAACFLRPRETPSTEGGVSAPSLAGLLPVRPVELSDKGLIVEPL
ncbi:MULTISPECIES: MiaB/RimO family radical SAM methylthiotransferase [Desulfovibrio]|uniref:Radical SAM methylthiotransferase, MiaB/RimO family n=1 Tax=Desulfovibrio desulfuricans TaxID=876 RepID=A0AA94L2E9_DESDE|nr:MULTISPECIES: radical SAM protein [Desulfovibrio]ATD81525.1 tRNA (N6-isopentenyl adenosine(37)-C2)-methylthiotransferase MiaB [Desulfovibrio sp. G11]SFW51727.1 radical SAM methylthiotransferase, MiaB/RimO family [Desulfovibrio desulfuricans]SPD34230.1 Methylthiotransferase [Desulfovibrio sp. G11]